MLASGNAVVCNRGLTKIERRLSYLTAYCAGWAKGTPSLICNAVSEDFVLHDTLSGRAPKNELDAALCRLKEIIDGLPDGRASTAYLTLSDPVVASSHPTTTVWCCFAVPGTGIQGVSQIRLGDDGVTLEHRIHKTRPHVRIAGVRSRR